MPNPDTAITWRLRELMATAGMFQTTELIGMLAFNSHASRYSGWSRDRQPG